MRALNNTAVQGRVYSKILNFLSYRKRSLKELSDRLDTYLEKEKLDDENRAGLKNSLIEKLTALGFIDDLDFAKTFVSQKISSKRPVGKRLLSSQLYKKGISNEIIEAVLSSYESPTEYESALGYARKKFNSEDQWNLKAKGKLVRYLYSRGFSSDIIYAVVDTITGVP